MTEPSKLASIVVAEGCNALIHTATNTLLYGCQNTIIPDGVTSIRESAFCDCSSLTDIVIPASVKSIGEDTFENCGKLRTIRYGGTIAQWKEIAHYPPAVCCRRVVRCTDGDTRQWK